MGITSKERSKIPHTKYSDNFLKIFLPPPFLTLPCFTCRPRLKKKRFWSLDTDIVLQKAEIGIQIHDQRSIDHLYLCMNCYNSLTWTQLNVGLDLVNYESYHIDFVEKLSSEKLDQLYPQTDEHPE